MSKVDQAFKEAWQWTENTEPDAITAEHVKTAYRLHLKGCKLWKCKRNCKLNPHCLSGLGEKIWQEDVKVEDKDESEDPCNVVRMKGNFVGLTNLGATCYVNSLLQLWFHNPDFRKAIYGWLPCDDPAEKSNPLLEKVNEGGYVPVSPIGQLQLLFALMQFSKRSCVNPTSFICSLGLDTTTQQDAQEFSKLFVSMLEDRLSHQSNPKVSAMVQRQFRGDYEYVTKCFKCHTESSSPSPFYELDLSLGSKAHVTLSESLAEFLHEEKLEGTDQYFCSCCGSKQNATRSIRLRKLPPVLNIQLLRFVFDRKMEQKKKVSSSVHFPEVLEMNSYVQNPSPGVGPSDLTYNLAAVLIHRGPSAYSGHYVAHIRDPVSGAWYKFNDEVVQKLEGKKLKLGTEDELEESKKCRGAAKVAKGMHASSNAYMLVYCRSNSTSSAVGENGSGPQEDISILPPWVRTTVDCENDNFEAWTRDVSQRKDHNLKMNREKRDTMRQMYSHLPCDPASAGGDFIAAGWLSSWLSDQNDLGPINNSALLCSHDKVNPEKYKEYKLVSSSVADALYSQYHGGPRLSLDSMCWDCVRAKCLSIRLKSQLDADSKTVTNLLKNKIEPSEPSYWVGRDSVRSWKRLVLERLLNQAPSSAADSSVAGKNGAGEDHETDIPIDPDMSMDVTTKSEEPSDDVKVLKRKNGTINGKMDANGLSGSTQWQEEFLKTLDERPKSADSMELGFNDDLLCSHGNLCVEEGPRRLVQSAVWKIFIRYFPEALEFKSTNNPCELCSRMAYEEVQTRETNKKMALEQRQLLADLFRSKNRPMVSRPSFERAHILARDIVDKWRAFIRDPTRREPVKTISNSSLLCPHGGLLHRPSAADDDVDNKFVLIWPEEWEKLVRFVDVDTAVVIRKSILNGDVSLETDPAVCETCLAQRLEEERRSQLDYQKAVIYVRQICPNDKNAAVDAECLSPFVSSSAAGGNTAAAATATESSDPDFQVGSGCKKPRLEPGVMLSPVVNATPSSGLSASRRSQRQRRVRGEKEIVVSSDQTLRDLKVEIMKKFRIPPYDQHLICNGRDLSDNQASLAALGIYPGTVIYLQADEPTEDPSIMEDYARTVVPEEGFKGTGLLQN